MGQNRDGEWSPNLFPPVKLGPLWRSKSKRRRWKGAGETSGAKLGEGESRPADGPDAKRFCTLVPWLVHSWLEVRGTPRCPAGGLQLEALARFAWSRSGVRGGWPPSLQTDSGVEKLGQAACQPGPSPLPFQAWRHRERWGWVALLIRRPPAERARPSLRSTSLLVWRRINRVIWVIAFQETSSGQRLRYILNLGLQLVSCLLGCGGGGSLTQV